jgi:hypothetical protein
VPIACSGFGWSSFSQNFNGKSQPPRLGGTGSAHVYSHHIAGGSVRCSFIFHTSLAIHDYPRILADKTGALTTVLSSKFHVVEPTISTSEILLIQGRPEKRPICLGNFYIIRLIDGSVAESLRLISRNIRRSLGGYNVDVFATRYHGANPSFVRQAGPHRIRHRSLCFVERSIPKNSLPFLLKPMIANLKLRVFLSG